MEDLRVKGINGKFVKKNIPILYYFLGLFRLMMKIIHHDKKFNPESF